MAGRKLIVEIVGDSRSLERAYQRSTKAGQKFEASITGVGRTVAGVAAGVGLALGGRETMQGIQASVMAASDLEEQMNRTRVVFGQSADSVTAWSERTAKSFGIAQREALAAAGNFGTMFRTIGVAAPQAASMSRILVELAADMASFNNTDPSEMLDRLRSGLSGEAEPLRRFGILISEARVQQEAYRAGLAKTGAKLTEQVKVQARYNLILRDSALQQGDFAKTSDSLANQLRVLNAEWDEAQATLGKYLIPAVAWLIEGFNEWTRDVGILARAFDRAFAQMAARFVGYAEKIAAAAAHIPFFGSWADDAQEALLKMKRDLEGHARRVGQHTGRQFGLGFQAGLNEHLQQMKPRDVTPGGGGGAAAFKASAEQRNQWFDAMIGRRLDRVQDVAALQGQIATLQKIAAMIQARLKITKDITRRLTLEDQLLGVQRQIQSAREQIAAEAQRARQERIESQFGWLEFAIERAEATDTVKDDLKAWRALESALKERIRQEGRTLDLMRDLWRARERIRDLNKKKASTDPMAGLMQASTRKLTQILTAGTGLTGRGLAVFGANLSGLQARQPLVVSVQVDGREIGRAATTAQTRAGKRTARQTSGSR